MFDTTVGALRQQSYEQMQALQEGMPDHRLYLFRDGTTILSVGQSKDVLSRVRSHLGLGTEPKNRISRVGRLIQANVPASLDWQVVFLTEQECLDRLPAHPFSPFPHSSSSGQSLAISPGRA